MMMRSRIAGTSMSVRRSDGGTTCSVRCRRTISAEVPPPNGVEPVTSSYRMTPAA